MGLTLVTRPAVEPLATEEAKDWLRIDADVTVDDDTVAALVKAARTRAENLTNRAIITQTWRLTLRGFYDPRRASQDAAVPDASQAGYPTLADVTITGGAGSGRWIIELPKCPVQAEDSSDVTVQYLDTSGTWQTLDPALYEVDPSEEPAVLAPAYGQSWPATRPALVAVKITWTAGYGNAGEDVPEDLRLALRGLVLYEYEGDPKQLQAVMNMLGPYWIGECPGEVR